MGAAASVQLVYSEAIGWFQQYFNADSYISDFDSIDKDRDGYIQLKDVEAWIKEKALHTGGPWKYFVQNPQIYLMAHEHASRYLSGTSRLTIMEKKVVDVYQFRALLVQLFAISILWLHFKKADEFLLAGDAFNLVLNKTEFKLGVRSFCAAYGHEEVSDEELDQDFEVLDTDRSGNISFNEVCDFCCQFIDPHYIHNLVKKDLSRDGEDLDDSESNSSRKNGEEEEVNSYCEEGNETKSVEEEVLGEDIPASDIHDGHTLIHLHPSAHQNHSHHSDDELVIEHPHEELLHPSSSLPAGKLGVAANTKQIPSVVPTLSQSQSQSNNNILFTDPLMQEVNHRLATRSIQEKQLQQPSFHKQLSTSSAHSNNSNPLNHLHLGGSSNNGNDFEILDSPSSASPSAPHFPVAHNEHMLNKAMENVISAVENNQAIQQLEEVKLATEMALEAQGYQEMNN